jgi:hypothetical protein
MPNHMLFGPIAAFSQAKILLAGCSNMMNLLVHYGPDGTLVMETLTPSKMRHGSRRTIEVATPMYLRKKEVM